MYALTYDEALAVLKERGHTETASWKKGRYSVVSPGAELIRLLEKYKTEPGQWRDRIAKVLDRGERKSA